MTTASSAVPPGRAQASATGAGSAVLPLTTTPQIPARTRAATGLGVAAGRARKRLSTRVASGVALLLAVLWTVPTLGLAVSSFRPQRDVSLSGWWTVFTNPHFTLDNYRSVLGDSGGNLSQNLVSSIVIVIPSVLLPLALATLAAYVFAWVDFRGRDILFVAVFALQIVPIQVTLIPLLKLYVDTGLNGSFWPIWLSHTAFALPLAVFLLHNFMKEIPRELIEAARMDGAKHVQVFTRVLLPLLTPALAAFGIFQFLWVWNDLLVALTFAGGTPEISPLTVGVANLAGTRDSAYHLLSAGALLSIVVPVAVFLALQRFFVRGLLAGGLKG